MRAFVPFLVGTLLLGACGATPGARPTDMSAAAHEAEAKQHGEEAAGHAAQSALAELRERCRKGAARVGTEACWTSIVATTSDHDDEARRHRQMAADHRAASTALLDAEAGACAGLSEVDRDTSPFDHREDIAGSEPLLSAASSAKGAGGPHVVGASVTIRAVPGVTKEYLQRLVDCHTARNASMGFSMPEMASCPLSVKGASATVASAGPAFRVDIRAEDIHAAEEILRRATALTAAR